MSAAPPARLRVAVVGAGRVGSALGVALARAGHHIVAVSAVSDAVPAPRRADAARRRVLPVDEAVARR